MTDSSGTSHPPLEVEVYLRLSQEDDAYLCEIVAGGDGCIEQVIYDGGREVILATDSPALTRYTLRELVGQDALMKLVRAVAALLRQIVRADRVAVLALGSPAEDRGAHWLIAPLRGASRRVQSAPCILGMPQITVPLSERGVQALAGHIRRALAG